MDATAIRAPRWRLVLTAALAAAVIGSVSAQAIPIAAATTTPLDGYGFAGDCYAMRTASGRYVARNPIGGYSALGTSAAQATPFRMQASALGRYMFYDRSQRLITAGPVDTVLALPGFEPSTDWQLDAAGEAYTVTSIAVGKALAVAPLTGILRLVAVDKAGTAGQFRLEPATGCATFPEAEVNAVGKPFTGQNDAGEVRGLLDMHVHAMNQDAFGGGVICGKAWDPQGIAKALVDCPDHEPAGLGAWFENVTSGAYGPTGAHDTRGWPTFRDFPKANSVTHQQTYHKWMERSWRGGLRVATVVLSSNRALCEVYPVKRTSCDEMDTVRLQAQRVYELQDYIDAQYQGRGKGWFRVVRDPYEARQVIKQGKLAVVLSIEVSELFGCRLANGVPQCDRDDIDRGMDEVWALGVRQLQLINKFDNALAGVRFDSGPAGVVVNGGNFLTTGKFWQAETCTTREHDNEIATSDPSGVIGTPLQRLLPGTLPVYPPAPHCNKLGLTELGAYTIKRMISKGMIIDLDHLSVKATDQALAIIEAHRYPAVVSGHSWLDPHFYARIYHTGGMVALYGFQSPQFAAGWEHAKRAHDEHHAEGFFGFGFGSDANGIGAQPVARPDAAHNHPVEYPFRSFDGGTLLDRQRNGERVYDINTDGVAHYGLRPDWIEDLRMVAGDRIVDDMAKGAEAYLRVWAGGQEWTAP
ncbi:MAG: discoidin domain-containing protein [Micromonosporaceae bacterium]